MSDAAAELVRLTVVFNEVEAEMIRGLLTTEGIDSLARPTDVSAGAFDGWSPGGAREILVRSIDLERARKLVLEQADARPSTEDQDQAEA